MPTPSSARQLLPNRRETETFRFDQAGHRYFGSVSRFKDGRPAEVFLDAGKPGASIQAIARDGAVFASLALQFGCPLEVLRKAVTRLDDGSAAGPFGKTTDEARSPVQVMTGTLTANRNLIVPTSEAWYLVKNATSGNFTATVKTASGSGVIIPPNSTYLVYCDGTDVVDGLMKVLLADFTVQSSDASASTGPKLILDRNSASPAASDAIGEIQFLGRDSGGNSEKYASIDAIIIDPTSASEDGRLRLRTVVASSLGTRFVIDNGLYSNNATGGDKGADTINAKGYYLDGTAINADPEATTAQYLANTVDRTLTTDKVWAAGAEVTLTDAATIAVNMATFINAVVTLGGNRTLGQPSNAKVGQCGKIRIIQDGTGNRTLGYHSDWKFAGGIDPVLSTAAGSMDLLYYDVIAANVIYANLVKAIA